MIGVHEPDVGCDPVLEQVRGPDGQPLDMATLTLLAQTVKDKYGDNMSDAQNAQMMAHEAHKQRKRWELFCFPACTSPLMCEPFPSLHAVLLGIDATCEPSL